MKKEKESIIWKYDDLDHADLHARNKWKRRNQEKKQGIGHAKQKVAYVKDTRKSHTYPNGIFQIKVKCPILHQNHVKLLLLVSFIYCVEKKTCNNIFL